MKERQFTPFFVSFEEAINDLDDKDVQLSLYRAIVRYGLYGEVPELSGIAATLWRLILPALQSNRKQFINGSSGGAPKGNQNARKTTQKQPNDNPKTSLKDKDKDKDKDINKLSNESKESADKPRRVASKRPAFVAPSLEIVKDYFSTIKGGDTDAECFHDHFTANGWKVSGKSSMKDWKAAARNWMRRKSEFSTTPQKQTNHETKRIYKDL